MGGTIIVSSERRVATSTSSFDYLVERIRSEFDSSDLEFIGAIYEPLDEGGMMYISLLETGSDGFNAFVRAADRARSTARSDGTLKKFHTVWEELFSALSADDRCR